MTPLDLAKIAYAAYGDTTGGKNFRGDPMPDWDNLGEPIQAAWIAAVSAVTVALGDELLAEAERGAKEGWTRIHMRAAGSRLKHLVLPEADRG